MQVRLFMQLNQRPRLLSFLICLFGILLILSAGCAAVPERVMLETANGLRLAPPVHNFHQVSHELYRSAQPDDDEWGSLAEFGIKSVINLRDVKENTDRVGNTGIVTYLLPMKAHKLTEEDLIKVLSLIRKAPKPVLIHCYHGSDRTGAAVAAYRVIFQNWTPEAAAKEMVEGDYGHHGFWFPNLARLIRNADYKKIRSSL